MTMNPEEKKRTRAILKEHYIENVHSTDFPGNYRGYDDSWNLEKFKKKFKIRLIKLADMEMEFDIIGLDVAIVNSFRRILISEVPTMAIEKVYLYNNTTIIQDEVLVQRLALVPIKADPRLFEYRQKDDEQGTAEDTLEFTFETKCTLRELKSYPVYSGQLKWNPIGSQAEVYNKNDIKPVHDDILIAKVRYGHEIDMKVHCVKGIGKDHTKFSPVATASYRLLPEITLLREVSGKQAEKLLGCFSPGVIELLDQNGTKVAKVKDARKDTYSRNILRHDDIKDCVEMARVKNHVIFSIESTGALTPDILVVEAIKVLMGKCQTFLDELAVN